MSKLRRVCGVYVGVEEVVSSGELFASSEVEVIALQKLLHAKARANVHVLALPRPHSKSTAPLSECSTSP